MKASYASLILGLFFLILSFLIPQDAIDFNFHDAFYVIAHSAILRTFAFALFVIAILLFQKHRVKKT